VVTPTGARCELRTYQNQRLFFTEDAVRVTLDGPVVGRSAIEKDLTEAFKVYNHESSKVNQVMVINGMIFANGSWGGKIQGPNGLSQRIRGCLTAVPGRCGWTHSTRPDLRLRRDQTNKLMPKAASGVGVRFRVVVGLPPSDRPQGGPS
jgi:hypothetical protein